MDNLMFFRASIVVCILLFSFILRAALVLMVMGTSTAAFYIFRYMNRRSIDNKICN